MQPDDAEELQRKIDEEVAAAEQEAQAAIGAAPEHPAPTVIKRKRGRPPKSANTAPATPFTNATAPVVVDSSHSITPSKAGWEPTPLDDLRERLKLLHEVGAETYEDGALKITFNRDAAASRGSNDAAKTTRW